MRTIVSLTGVLFLLFNAGAALAAKRLGPPIEQLASEPDRIRIVIAEAHGNIEPGKIRFSVSERLSGESPDSIDLRMDPETLVDVAPGKSYIVAWSYLRRNRGLVEGWEVDPDGPATVQVVGLGSTALFEDTPELRFLFSTATQSGSAGPVNQLDALLAQMSREDYRSRGLVITELYLRPDLEEMMDPDRVDEIRRVLQTKNLDPQHRDYLLRVALNLSPELTSPWLAEEFRKSIILHGTQYDLTSYVPGLVRTAARGLQQTGSPKDVPLLSTLLYSNNPGVAKAALAAMNQLDAPEAAAQANLAIGRGWIHAESRRAIERYLEGVDGQG